MADFNVLRMLMLAGLVLWLPAQAQAPAEERPLSADVLEASQQRISALRRDVQSADEVVKQTEQENQEAQARLADARARAAATASALKAARAKQALAREAYRKEAAAFDALRLPSPATGGAKSAAASSVKP